jgi:hypothetical protein
MDTGFSPSQKFFHIRQPAGNALQPAVSRLWFAPAASYSPSRYVPGGRARAASLAGVGDVVHGRERDLLKAVVNLAVGELNEISEVPGAGVVDPLAGAEGDPFLVTLAVPEAVAEAQTPNRNGEVEAADQRVFVDALEVEAMMPAALMAAPSRLQKARRRVFSICVAGFEWRNIGPDI